jgi:hypothetical protein
VSFVYRKNEVFGMDFLVGVYQCFGGTAENTISHKDFGVAVTNDSSS